ncbi:GntR family transcriptional regulator [Teichococcus cervicalis]|uniref:Transcriptional regulator, GntR family n=1 Tax=Pseudoroseomonas cervicalis ATCC 49957 TaxID=525371 RepID=D5RPW5_9PROT|nr:GntR family transcriptional regulator [Pseudoroseomonas cervicalis]EFH10656.1 transcriptional regulator, GntR family [Pseudoroseomonas cervicalis ATCC 49957]
MPDTPTDLPDQRDSRPASLNLSGLAYRAVSEMIRDRRLRGGETVVEQRLAETLGISRTPLREALQRLEGEGLVVKAANRSFVVRHVDLAEYLHSLKVREILEPEAAALAVGHIPMGRLHAIRAEAVELHAAATHTHEHWVSDDHVHRIYAAHCGNEVMARLIEGLRTTTRLFEIARLSDRVGPDSSEHIAILDALIAGDARAARRAVQQHLRSLSRFSLAVVR